MRKKLLALGMAAVLSNLTACNHQGSAFPDASLDVGIVPRAWASVRALFVTGKSEFHKALAAKTAARTWRMRTEMRMHPGQPLITTVDVSCPDHEHMTGELGSSQYEAIRIGAQSFVKGPDQYWQKSIATPDVYPCGNNPGMPAPWAMMSEGRDLIVILARLIDEGGASPARGPLVKIDGGICQEWTVQFSHPDKSAPNQNPRKMSYSICLDTRTHLPRQIIVGKGAMVTTYSDWNVPMNIQVPTSYVETAKN